MEKTELGVNRIGILTSGGDAPGMNAAIRGAVRTAQCMGIQCVGIRHGYAGLINGDFTVLDESDVSGITKRGGTMLYTARSKEFQTEEGLQRAVDTCKYMGIEGLITIGGDGTFRGALELYKRGIKVIGIPCTIDNDIGCTTYTIGFDTACNTAIDAVDKLGDTMQSHERCSVVEVMGHETGYLALNVGIATGATITLIPEVSYDFDKDVIGRIRTARLAGRTHFMVIVAEAMDPVQTIAEKINQATGIETRVTALGHVQRGGDPLMRDRVIATSMGYRAVMLLAEGKNSRVVAMDGDIMIDLDIEEALAKEKVFDMEQYRMFTALTFLDKGILR
ncbi:MAG: 6-phosphofructokinase [Oscillospiraceae bacterium]|nr:6-phosphofructokinase [Oscillospiraceae bacterium]